VSVPVSAIWIDPQTPAKGGVGYGPRWQAMAQALHLNLSELAHRVQSASSCAFSLSGAPDNPEQAEWIDKLHLPGLICAMSRVVFIPQGTWRLICWALPISIIRASRGEKSFNAQLTGQPGRRLVRKDKHGNVIENITEVPAVPAHNLQLSIDERLQTVTEDALDNAVRWNKAESGAAVLIKIDTGEILAMASYPDFNPTIAMTRSWMIFAIAPSAIPSSRVDGQTAGADDRAPAGDCPAGQRGGYPSVFLDGHRIRDVGYYPSCPDRDPAKIQRYRRVASLAGHAGSASDRYL
jgi:cell division protein FtsI (penicillin-binding protein 3)